MHAVYRPGSRSDAGAAGFYASFPEPKAVAAPVPAIMMPAALPELPSRFGEDRRPNWVMIASIVAVHALLLFALVKFDVIQIDKPKPAPLVVALIPEAAPPPPVQQEVAPPEAVVPRIVAPKAIVDVPAPVPVPVPVVAVSAPMPPQAVLVAPAAPAGPTPAAPVAVADLSSKMISGSPPKYPIESRRKREQGTVVLTVLLNVDGGVADVGVARSSGFQRLDKAALDAVRRWRWSPTLQGGKPMMVRGIVDIPFVLQS